MAMSKKHYAAVAKIMQGRFEVFRMYADSKRNVPVDACKRQFGAIVYQLADLFKEDNPNFDRKRFIKACATLTENELILRESNLAEVEF